MVNRVSVGVIHQNNEKRAIFVEGFNEENDKNKVGKIGVRCHNWFTGFFRLIVGNAVKIKTNEGKTVYLNKNSLRKWKVRHMKDDHITPRGGKNLPTIQEIVDNKLNSTNKTQEIKSPVEETLRVRSTKEEIASPIKEPVHTEEIERRIVNGYINNEAMDEIAKEFESEQDKNYFTTVLDRIKQQKVEVNYEKEENFDGIHPYANNDNRVFDLIALLNSQLKISSDLSKQINEKLNECIGNLEKPEWKDQLISCLKDEDYQKELRIKHHLLKKGDIVLKHSQGLIEKFSKEYTNNTKFTNEQGKNACASICAQAIFHLAANKEISDGEMYKIIGKGVKDHVDRGFAPKTVVFTDLIQKINDEGGIDGQKLNVKAIALSEQGDDEIDKWRLADPLEVPYQGKVKKGFSQLLQSLKKLSEEEGQQFYGVLTCGAETVLAFYNSDNTLSLFDSHGKPYQGVNKGASLRKFDTVQDLDEYLKAMYHKKDKDVDYSFLMVGC